MRHRTVALLLLIGALGAFGQDSDHAAFVKKEVDGGIVKGLKALRDFQNTNGSFPYLLEGGQGFNNNYPIGLTALGVYTLLWCDVPETDPAVKKAFDYLKASDPFCNPPKRSPELGVYEISLLSMALSESLIRAKEAKRTIAYPWSEWCQQAADWLVAAQCPGGGWSYQKNMSSHDHSNTQFAIMGLRAAMNAGAKVPNGVWERELTHMKTGQCKDGGWDYTACYQRAGGISTPSMTAAGIMGVALTLSVVQHKTDPAEIAKDTVIKKGLEALAAAWKAAASTPNIDYYWLYSVERACVLSGTTKLGGIDWYVEGAYKLLKAQEPNGAWIARQYGVVDHCFALLFLKKAHVSLGVITQSGGGPKPTASPSASPSPEPEETPTPTPPDGRPKERD